MHPYDFSPLFRSTIGFERLSRLLNATIEGNGAAASYPPYNIEKTGEDAYRITLAVAGFDKADLDITVTDDTLVVKGGTKDRDGEATYLHRGIAGRALRAGSGSPTTSGSPTPIWSTACCTSISCARCPTP